MLCGIDGVMDLLVLHPARNVSDVALFGVLNGNVITVWGNGKSVLKRQIEGEKIPL